MTMPAQKKQLKMMNYSGILNNELFGNVASAPSEPLTYSAMHATFFEVTDIKDEAFVPVTVIVLDHIVFPLSDWNYMLDKELNINTQSIAAFMESLKNGISIFEKTYATNTIKTTMRDLCGYGDAAETIIAEKVKLYQQQKDFTNDKAMALYIYKRINHDGSK